MAEYHVTNHLVAGNSLLSKGGGARPIHPRGRGMAANLVSYSSSSSEELRSSDEDEPAPESRDTPSPDSTLAESRVDDNLVSPPAKRPRNNDTPEPLSLPPAILAMFNDEGGMYSVII